MNKFIIIVTYEPDIAHLKRIVEILVNLNCHPIVVDNSDINKLDKKNINSNILLIDMDGNKGIAEAQNAGIRMAFLYNADIIGFLDQDSNITEELMKELLKGISVKGDAVVAPVAIDVDSGIEYPSQIISSRGIPRNVFALGEKKPVKVDYVISSGMIMTRKVLELVGFYDEDFFIDFVDIEWCLRCKKKKIPIFVFPNAVLAHKIGREIRNIGPFTLSVHSPIRTYYKVRNSFLLLHKELNKLFVFRQIIPAVVYNFFLIFDKKHGKDYRKYYFVAIKDGLLNKKGKYLG